MRTHFFACLCVCLIKTMAAVSLQTENWNIVHYGETTFENLDFCGYITLDGTKIYKKAHINGYMQAKSVDFHRLTVKGHANIQESRVHRETTIEGVLLAIRVKFSEKLTCRCSKITLSHCKLDSLHILNPENGEQPLVELCDGTEISGSIIFESKNGRVIASQDSVPNHVKKGKVQIENINGRY